MTRGAALLWVAGLLAGLPARAGVTVTLQGRGGTTTLTVEGNRVRLEEGGEISIFDGEKRTLLSLATADRTYTVTTEAELRALGRRLKAEIGERRDQLGPEQRRQLEALTRPSRAGKASPPSPPFLPTGRMERVAGLECEVHRHEHQGRTVEELCLVPWGKEALARSDLAAFERMASFFAVLLEEIGPGAAEAIRTSRSNLAAMPGFPARTVAIREDGKGVEEEVLTGLTRSRVPPSAFAVPEGYRRVDER